MFTVDQNQSQELYCIWSALYKHINIHIYNIQYDVLLAKQDRLEIIHGFVLQKVKTLYFCYSFTITIVIMSSA